MELVVSIKLHVLLKIDHINKMESPKFLEEFDPQKIYGLIILIYKNLIYTL